MINGRRYRRPQDQFSSITTTLNPAKTVEQTRKLIEGDNVRVPLFDARYGAEFAVVKYINSTRVPICICR